MADRKTTPGHASPSRLVTGVPTLGAAHWCWKQDWVLDIDVRAFFDSVPHSLLLKAVARHTGERWVLLYVARWLKAPVQMPDGTMMAREKGTPQGNTT